MRIHWLQHVPFEGLGSIEDWARSRGHELVPSRLWDHDPLPGASEIEFLIVMGGPMGVGDEADYPWLTSEKDLIAKTIERGSSVFGVCLGAQLIASAIGAAVAPDNQKEIGWFPVTLTAEGTETDLMSGVPHKFMAFHWHGDTFEIPRSATHLASTQACENQAFSVGSKVLALQFHIETVESNVDALIENCADELVGGDWIQDPEELRAGVKNSPQATGILSTTLDRMTTAAF